MTGESCVGFAAPSMFGLRWINPATMRWHRGPSCPSLKAMKTRCGWESFPISLGYGAEFYRPCGRCVPEAVSD